MCFKIMKNILTNPKDAIKTLASNNSRKKKNKYDSLWVLLVSWLIAGFGLFLVAMKAYSIIISLSVWVVIFFVGSLITIFLGYLLTRIMNILGGKGKTMDGIAAISYGMFPISLALPITAALSLIHPSVGFLGFVFTAILAALGFSTYFRAVKVLFKTDMVKVLIGFLVFLYVVMISMYLTLAITSGTSFTLLNAMAAPLGLA